MPRPAINDYVFYKIVNVNADVDLCYVGSTANWKQRQKDHKYRCNCETDRKYNYKLYKTIRENGGWDEFKMVEIGRGEQLTLREAQQKEEEYRVKIKANMNMIRCFVSNEDRIEKQRLYSIGRSSQYYHANKELLKEKSKIWREENNEVLLAKKKDYYQANRELIISRQSEYYSKNIDKINTYRKEIITCECGCEILRGSLHLHRKSKKHQAYINHTDGM